MKRINLLISYGNRSFTVVPGADKQILRQPLSQDGTLKPIGQPYLTNNGFSQWREIGSQAYTVEWKQDTEEPRLLAWFDEKKQLCGVETVLPTYQMTNTSSTYGSSSGSVYTLYDGNVSGHSSGFVDTVHKVRLQLLDNQRRNLSTTELQAVYPEFYAWLTDLQDASARA